MPHEKNKQSVQAYQKLRMHRPDLFVDNKIIRLLSSEEEILKAIEVEGLWNPQYREAEEWEYGVLLDDPYLGLIVRDPVQFNGGHYGLYNRHIAKTGCLVLPILDRRIVVIKIFRHSLRNWSWELPGGLVSDGCLAEDAAKTELEEEIGAQALHLTSLGAIRPYIPLSNCILHLFAANISALGQLQEDEGIVDRRILSMSEVDAMIVSGEINDASAISCIYKAKIAGLI